MNTTKAQIAAAAAALTVVMTALATLTAAHGVVPGLVALVFAVSAIGIGALTLALLQAGRREDRTGTPDRREPGAWAGPGRGRQRPPRGRGRGGRAGRDGAARSMARPT